MPGLLKKALGTIIDFEDDSQKNVPAQSITTFAAFASTTVGVGQTTSGLTTEEIEKFSAHFDDLMEKADLPGPDYYEFTKAMQTFEKIIPDEKVRIAVAFASLTVNAKGLTKAVLVDTAGKYIEVIENDRQKFQDALKAKLQGEVDARKQQIDVLAATIEACHKQIADIQTHITENERQMKALNDDAASAETRIRKNESAYMNACELMVAKIKGDVQKIQTILT